MHPMKILLVAIPLFLAACGGGDGGDGDGGDVPTAKSFTFSESFSDFPNGQWTASDTMLLALDPTRGDPSAPCMRLWNHVDLTSNAPQGAGDVSGGVVVTARVAFPDPTTFCATNSGFAWPFLSVKAKDDAFPLAAWVSLELAPCADPIETLRLHYQAGVVGTFEVFTPGEFVPGKFYEFTFELQPNGPIRWLRDGVPQATGSAPSLSGEVEIELDGIFATAADPLCFDNIGILR